MILCAGGCSCSVFRVAVTSVLVMTGQTASIMVPLPRSKESVSGLDTMHLFK